MKTLQEVFDHGAKHLLTQNAKSLKTLGPRKGPSCMYRGPNGLKCAVGCFIPDEEYDPKIEHHGFDSTWGLYVTGEDFTPPSLMALKSIPQAWRLLAKLQDIHDSVPIREWASWLTDLAQEYSLNASVIQSYRNGEFPEENSP
jgi:hypothetical protein